jgi:hypothetical protein
MMYFPSGAAIAGAIRPKIAPPSNPTAPMRYGIQAFDVVFMGNLDL